MATEPAHVDTEVVFQERDVGQIRRTPWNATTVSRKENIRMVNLAAASLTLDRWRVDECSIGDGE